MTADLRSLDFACMDCGKRPSHYFPSGSFGLASASFLCVSCAEEREWLLSTTRDMFVRYPTREQGNSSMPPGESPNHLLHRYRRVRSVEGNLRCLMSWWVVGRIRRRKPNGRA
jgi:hypothetical protein